MILITSIGEFLLYFTVSLFLVSFHCKKKKKKKKNSAAGFLLCCLVCHISTAGLHVQ